VWEFMQTHAMVPGAIIQTAREPHCQLKMFIALTLQNAHCSVFY